MDYLLNYLRMAHTESMRMYTHICTHSRQRTHARTYEQADSREAGSIGRRAGRLQTALLSAEVFPIHD